MQERTLKNELATSLEQDFVENKRAVAMGAENSRAPPDPRTPFTPDTRRFARSSSRRASSTPSFNPENHVGRGEGIRVKANASPQY